MGQCERCAYLTAGPPDVCHTCVRREVPPIPDDACPVCSQQRDFGACRNALCNDQNRSISRIDAIGYHNDGWRRAIRRFKYEGHWGWGEIFGRVVFSHLVNRGGLFDVGHDLLVVNPTWSGESRSERCRIEAVAVNVRMVMVPNVMYVDETLVTDPTLVKTRATAKSAAADGQAKQAAAQELYDAVEVRHPGRVVGKRVLVLDDVVTTGRQLDAIARRLREAGAVSVQGLALARAPWR